jgi:hypothetical protein
MSLRVLLGLEVEEVFFLPDEGADLRLALQRSATLRRHLEPLGLSLDCHPTLIHAIRRVLRMAESSTLGPPPRTVVEVASAIGCSREHLSRVSCESGVDLRRLCDLCRIYWLVKHRSNPRQASPELARLLSYTDVGGLTKLARRSLDCGLLELRTVTLAQVAKRIESHLRRISDDSQFMLADHAE